MLGEVKVTGKLDTIATIPSCWLEPSGTLPKAAGEGAKVIVPFTPVPVIGTVVVAGRAPPPTAILSDEPIDPTEFGANATDAVQVAVAGRLVPQVFFTFVH
jgi:hypothetical protein